MQPAIFCEGPSIFTCEDLVKNNKIKMQKQQNKNENENVRLERAHEADNFRLRAPLE